MATENDAGKLDKIVEMARNSQESREKGYRAKSLKMYPWICGRCSREFTRENVTELTVHHRDHNHDNNPQDGSNWELLCVYCHDNEHSRYVDAGYVADGSRDKTGAKTSATHNPFADLASMFKNDPEK